MLADCYSFEQERLVFDDDDFLSGEVFVLPWEISLQDFQSWEELVPLADEEVNE